MKRDYLELLEQMGLTPNESKLYLALLDGPKTGQALSKATGIARTRVYVDLETLHARGFAERRDGKVRLFAARPPDAVLDSVLSEWEIELSKSKERASLLKNELQPLYRSVQELDAELPHGSQERITNLDVYVQKVQDLFSGVRNTVDHMACHPLIPRAFGRAIFQNAARRGVEIRFLMPREMIEMEALRKDLLEEDWAKSFEARFVDETPCRVTIFDNQTAAVCSPRDCQLEGRRVDVYLARQPEFIALHAAAFDHYWQESTPAKDVLGEWNQANRKEGPKSASEVSAA